MGLIIPVAIVSVLYFIFHITNAYKSIYNFVKKHITIFVLYIISVIYCLSDIHIIVAQYNEKDYIKWAIIFGICFWVSLWGTDLIILDEKGGIDKNKK